MRDVDSQKFLHRYIPNQEGKGHECFICNSPFSEHIDYEVVNNNLQEDVNLIVRENQQPTMLNNNLSSNPSTGTNNKISNQVIHINSININLPQSVLDDFEDPDICRICFVNKINGMDRASLVCGHTFCKQCVVSHLRTNISNGHVSYIFMFR